MNIDWEDVQRILTPMKDYEDLCQRLRKSFSYPFVLDHFNFSMPVLADYTKRLLAGDSKRRYDEYASSLVSTCDRLTLAGVATLMELKDRMSSRENAEIFVELSGIKAQEIISLLKFVIYWVIPGEKYLSGLVQNDPLIENAIRVLAGFGIRTNLEIIQRGITEQGRNSLASLTGLPIDAITTIVNIADFSRMPWASKATISNIIGAGYVNLGQLASANPEQLYEDFFHYGKRIGKNLKFGNEIESSYRIAKIIPVLIQHD